MLFRTLSLVSLMILSGCSVESAPARWQFDQESIKSLYQVQLDCETAPEIGPFQNCQVIIRTASGEAIHPQLVQMDGGMPAHGHGLPTTPVLRMLDKPGHYKIDGLKYNMSGNWLIGFRIGDTQVEDKVIFDFVI